MPFIVVKVTAAHIARSPSRGYGPRIILTALKERLADRVFVSIDACWVFFAHKGTRHYIHLPLHVIRYTVAFRRVPLLQPITFRLELPAELVKHRRRQPPRRAP